MDSTLFISFCIISFGVIIIPGPNVLIIVSTSMKNGTVRGLQTVAGTSSTMSIQLIIAGIGTSWFVQLLAEGFTILKWIGVAYLIYLGLQHLHHAIYDKDNETQLNANSSFS